MSKIIKIHPLNPHERAIHQAVDVLEAGGIIAYPTDTVYGLGCDIYNAKAMANLARIKGVKPDKAKFSIVCNDLSHLSEFTKPIDNTTFKLLKRAIPGPFTFVLEAAGTLPHSYKNHKTVGIRVPDHLVPQMIVRALGRPIASTSIHHVDEIIAYTTDPEEIYESHKNIVDLVIDSGFGGNKVSTIVDLTTGTPEIIRQGAGDLDAVL